jgi:phosphate-selective porin OprO/OprP
MKLLPNLLALAVLAALSAPAQAETEFDVIGGSEISFEGLIQADYNGFNNDIANLNGSAFDGKDSDSQIRRSELVFKGKGPGMWNWVVGYDATAKKFLDTNVSYKFSGFTSVTFGQFKQPISMEELSSTKNNDFTSKAMATNLYGISRRFGLSAATGSDNWTLTGSVFGRELTRNLGEGNGYGGRFTFAPINEAGNILHFGLSGVSFAARDPGGSLSGVIGSNGDHLARLRVRPDADLTNTRLVDSGQIADGDRVAIVGVEGAWVHGPIKIQSEYMTANISRNTHADFKSNSWYVYGVWNLTGETWGYKNGVITTGLPDAPASGMWQVGVRYDKADLNDGSVNFANPASPVVTGVMGGKESNWTVGVNWYWRSNFKFALNYVKVSSEKYIAKTGPAYSADPAWNNRVVNNFLKDDPSIIELRAQIYW